MMVPRMRLILLTAVVMLTAGILVAWQAAWVGPAVAAAVVLVVLTVTAINPLRRRVWTISKSKCTKHLMRWSPTRILRWW